MPSATAPSDEAPADPEGSPSANGNVDPVALHLMAGEMMDPSNTPHPCVSPEGSLWPTDDAFVAARNSNQESEIRALDGLEARGRLLPQLPPGADPPIVALPELERGEFVQRPFATLGTPLPQALAAVAEVYGEPDAMDATFYVNVRALGDTPERWRCAFHVDPSRTPEDDARIEAFADALRVQASELGLSAYELGAGWADATGAAYHGIALVDEARGLGRWAFVRGVWSE